MIENYVKELFKNHYDRAGKPYYAHLKHVADTVKHLGPEYYAVGLLHDALEDIDGLTENDLRERFPMVVVDAVVALTKKDGEAYEDYLARVKANEIACAVKLADIEHNSDLSRLSVVADEDRARLVKYKKAVEFLK